VVDAVRLHRARPRLDDGRGITFYEHGETPGLGGEIDNPRGRPCGPTARSSRRRARHRGDQGAAGPPEDDPYRVDGLSGATITSRGVTQAAAVSGSGEDGFGPYLDKSARGGRRGMMLSKNKRALLDPLFNDNPIALQVLGICSALAVTTKLETSVVMSLAVIACCGCRTCRSAADPQGTPAVEHPDHRAADDHRVARDRHRSDPQGRRLRHQQAAVGVCRPDHHELHHHGSRRGLRDAESGEASFLDADRQRGRLQPDPALRRLLPRALRRRHALRDHRLLPTGHRRRLVSRTGFMVLSRRQRSS
jgi:hypothetical protein